MSDIENAISRVFDAKFAEMQHVSSVVEEASYNKNDLYKRKNAADILGVSLVTLDTWTRAGIIQSMRIGTRIYYTQKAIDEALKKTGK